VAPPTFKYSFILSLESPDSFMQFSQGLIVFLRKSSHSDSNLALEIVKFKCFGPV